MTIIDLSAEHLKYIYIYMCLMLKRTIGTYFITQTLYISLFNSLYDQFKLEQCALNPTYKGCDVPRD